MAQKQVLILYGARYSEYAEAFVAALWQREPGNQYAILNDAALPAFDEGSVEQYDRLIVLLTPDLIYAQTSEPEIGRAHV